ncbi:hypothetical protein [Streptomyces sp. FH025]|uniref:hypothetical protein n=1 Tax=Streptomyces sp. FH025 TaxID=2815937 RepID=UPI001A9DBC27|nr:hypothetical protein [Streptomyces sp. FH025]MBO1415622.1 hypothetical protein [Streptomyces sp. FH025]
MTTRESVSEHGLTVRAQHRHNPYDHLFDDAAFAGLLLDLGLRRAASIWRNHTAPVGAAPRDPYPRASMGFVLLDPTAGPWVPEAQSVMAVITVGEDAHRFLPRAAAKAAGHRRLGRNYGEAVLTDPHLCGSGGFRYGHSAGIRGQIVGASSQSTDQDLFEAGRLATELVDALASAQLAWEERTGPGDWYSPDDAPHPVYREMVAFALDRAEGPGTTAR